MLQRDRWLAGMYAALFILSSGAGAKEAKVKKTKQNMGSYVGKYKGDKVVKTAAEWKKILAPQAYDILREQSTESPFTGLYWNNHEKGTYRCAGCGLELFSSDTKFESGTGWPSFYQPLYPENVGSRSDHSYGMDRDEVVCPRCGGHLGHVFDDGPPPTHLRYCINSASVTFIADKAK